MDREPRYSRFGKRIGRGSLVDNLRRLRRPELYEPDPAAYIPPPPAPAPEPEKPEDAPPG